jgi:hypothetical protein
MTSFEAWGQIQSINIYIAQSECFSCSKHIGEIVNVLKKYQLSYHFLSDIPRIGVYDEIFNDMGVSRKMVKKSRIPIKRSYVEIVFTKKLPTVKEYFCMFDADRFTQIIDAAAINLEQGERLTYRHATSIMPKHKLALTDSAVFTLNELNFNLDIYKRIGRRLSKINKSVVDSVITSFVNMEFFSSSHGQLLRAEQGTEWNITVPEFFNMRTISRDSFLISIYFECREQKTGKEESVFALLWAHTDHQYPYLKLSKFGEVPYTIGKFDTISIHVNYHSDLVPDSNGFTGHMYFPTGDINKKNYENLLAKGLKTQVIFHYNKALNKIIPFSNNIPKEAIQGGTFYFNLQYLLASTGDGKVAAIERYQPYLFFAGDTAMYPISDISNVSNPYDFGAIRDFKLCHFFYTSNGIVLITYEKGKYFLKVFSPYLKQVVYVKMLACRNPVFEVVGTNIRSMDIRGFKLKRIRIDSYHLKHS